MRVIPILVAHVALVAALSGCVSSDVSREIGARCDARSECDDRCLRPSRTYPDGFCSSTCASDDECPSGARCVADDGGVCLFVCAGDPACEFLGERWECASRPREAGDGEVSVCRGG